MKPSPPFPPRHLVEGLLVGGADVVPGVSGGTVALIVGIYERLLDTLNAGFTAVTSVLRGDLRRARASFAAVDWGFILPLGAGIGSAIVIGSRVIPPLLERYPTESRALFFGLVAASLATPWLRIERPGWRERAAVPLAAVAAFLVVGLPPAVVEDPSLLRVFLSAAVAICAMILPGVSGSFLLAVLGMYAVSLEAVRAFDLVYIGVFMAGAAVGLGIFSRLLHWLLHRWHDVTMAALVGAMAGSLRALWPWQGEDRSLHLPGAGDPVAAVVALGVLGFVLVATLTWMGRRRIADETRAAR